MIPHIGAVVKGVLYFSKKEKRIRRICTNTVPALHGRGFSAHAARNLFQRGVACSKFIPVGADSISARKYGNDDRNGGIWNAPLRVCGRHTASRTPAGFFLRRAGACSRRAILFSRGGFAPSTPESEFFCLIRRENLHIFRPRYRGTQLVEHPVVHGHRDICPDSTGKARRIHGVHVVAHAVDR